MTIKAQFKYCVYDDSASGNGSGFTVVQYNLLEAQADGNCPVSIGAKFTAVGYYLSTLPKTIIVLTGEWVTAKRGLQFEVKECSEEIETTEYGITNFLASGLIRGVGKGLAKRIYATFGEETLEIMDNDIGQLIKVPGISKKKLERIRDSYRLVSGSRNLITFLGTYKISPASSQKLVRNNITLEMIKDNPYVILDVRGFSFPTADIINRSLGLGTHSKERISAAVMSTLRDNELSGNAGMEVNNLISKSGILLNHVTEKGPVSNQEIYEGVMRLIADEKVINVKNFLFRSQIYWAECDAAKEIAHLSYCGAAAIEDLPEKLNDWEEKNSVSFDDIQKKAVITALSYGFSVITGGPGRGKTTVARAITDIRKEYGKKKTLSLMAPTGRAARRLSESTGEEASTIHSALTLAEDSEISTTNVFLDAEQILVDEASMIDIWLFRTLLSSIGDNCNVTFIGDPNQLPSVGPGAVLRDVIKSGCVPVVKLEKVYRQAEGSTIVTNADLIEEGNTSLIMNKEFQCYRASTGKEALSLMISLYKKKCAIYGREEVALLSPFHHAKSEASSDSVNRYLQEVLNPASSSKSESEYLKRHFRVGDIVMQTKNRNGICNGDVGVIERIYEEDGEMLTEVIFDGSKQSYSYSIQELENLELAYCMTYHKVQGSEYKCVIGCLLDEHRNMLKRNLFYTGVTRAKEEYILVGTRSAMETAIKTIDSAKRITLLSEKIKYAFAQIMKQNPFLKETG